MNRRSVQVLTAALALGALVAPGSAWAMRCGTRLVVEGDSSLDVRSKCGEPTEVRKLEVLRPPVIWMHGRPVRVGHDALAVPVEIWTYNLGPLMLMRQLRIENGQVTRIDTLGYGYR